MTEPAALDGEGRLQALIERWRIDDTSDPDETKDYRDGWTNAELKCAAELEAALSVPAAPPPQETAEDVIGIFIRVSAMMPWCECGKPLWVHLRKSMRADCQEFVPVAPLPQEQK